MGNRFQPFTRFNGLVPLSIGVGELVDPVETQGFRLDSQGRIYAVLNGTIAHYHGGLPFNLHGRLVVGNGVDYWDQGIPFTILGTVAMDTDAIQFYDQSVPFDAEGEVVYSEGPSIPPTPPGEDEYYHEFTTKTLGGFTHTRASLATAPDETGIVQTYQVDDPAWYRDEGLQLEGSRTNEVPDSADPTTWFKSASVTIGFHGSIPSPDGTFNAVHMSTTTITSTEVAILDVAAVGMQSKVWARTVSGTGTARLLYRNDTVGAVNSNLNETWQLVSLPWLAAGASHLYIWDPRSGGGDLLELLVWSPQIEVGEFSTSSIITEGATGTRAVTSCSGLFSDLGAPLPPGGFLDNFSFQYVFRIYQDWVDLPDWTNIGGVRNDADGANRIALEKRANTNWLQANISSPGGAGYAYVDLNASPDGVPVAGDVIDMRFRYSFENLELTVWRGSYKGFTRVLTAQQFAAAIDIMFIGKYSGSGQQCIVEKVRIVPEALSDAEIEAWT